METALALVLAFVVLQQVAGKCKNCVTLGKEEEAMFRAHSEACLAVGADGAGGVDARAQLEAQFEALLRGEAADAPALRRLVYCVLRRCKLVDKDGKLRKAPALARLAARTDPRDRARAAKLLESCADQRGDSPEDLAWNLFRCGYDAKASLLNYMPLDTDNDKPT